MEYRKEKHYIVAQDGEKVWKWDILTNQYIGLKGKAIRSIPAPFTKKAMNGSIIENNLYNAYMLVLENSNGLFVPSYSAIGKRLEEVISVGLTVSLDQRTYKFMENDTTKLNKECVAYVKDKYRGIYSPWAINNYNTDKTYAHLMKKYPEYKEWIHDAAHCNIEIDVNFCSAMIERGIHEKVFTQHDGGPYGRLIGNWYKYSIDMGEEPEVKHNILTNYAILKWLHQQWQDAHLDETIKEKNDLPYLYYSTDEYIIRPLISKEDFHKEAEAQHNCVERMYMNQVIEGKTHVVVVRKKDNPDESFITCEVLNNNYINQFLYKFNAHLQPNDPLFALKRAYQHHLYYSSLK